MNRVNGVNAKSIIRAIVLGLILPIVLTTLILCSGINLPIFRIILGLIIFKFIVMAYLMRREGRIAREAKEEEVDR